MEEHDGGDEQNDEKARKAGPRVLDGSRLSVVVAVRGLESAGRCEKTVAANTRQSTIKQNVREQKWRR